LLLLLLLLLLLFILKEKNGKFLGITQKWVMIIYFNTPQLKVKKGPIVEASGIRQ